MTVSESFDKVRRYYDAFDEWSRLDSPAGTLEFARTMRVLETHLAPQSRILDLGGGPGRYTLALASAGHRVCLADLSENLISEARAHIGRSDAASNVESVEVANACDLSIYATASFDAVLALGPFYHLTSEADRLSASKEIARVLKPDGLLVAAFIPRLCGLAGLISRAAQAPNQVSISSLHRVAADGVFQNASDRGFQEGYYARPEDIPVLFENCGFQTTEVVSVRGIGYGQEQYLLQLRSLNADLSDRFLALIRETQSDPAVIAMGGHALYIGRKRSGVK